MFIKESTIHLSQLHKEEMKQQKLQTKTKYHNNKQTPTTIRISLPPHSKPVSSPQTPKPIKIYQHIMYQIPSHFKDYSIQHYNRSVLAMATQQWTAAHFSVILGWMKTGRLESVLRVKIK